MRCCLIQFVAISVLAFQCIQGTLCDTKRSIKRHHEGIELFKMSVQPFSRSDINDDQDVHKLSIPAPATLRTRRQNNGTAGDPKAYPYYSSDDHQYAKVNYLGEGSKVIFLLTYDKSSSSTSHTISSNLYRSTDNGQTFQNQYSKLQSGFRLHSIIYRFPNSKTVMFADTSRSTIYVTTDEGETFRSYNIPVNPRTLKIHPTMPGWILGHDSDQAVLMYSEDSGASWATVAQDIHPRYYSTYSMYDFTWGTPGVDWDINNPCQSDISKVFYTVRDLNTTSLRRNNRVLNIAQNFGDGYASKVFDYNLGYTSTIILNGNYIFAAKSKVMKFPLSKNLTKDFCYHCSTQEASIYHGAEVDIHVSYMRKPFNLTRIPTTFSNYFYFVGTHRSSQVLFIIEHDSHYSLYLSDETGIYFTLSLEDIVVDDSKSVVDLQIIDITNGTMIANQFVSRVDGSGRNQTLITFDNGAQWQKIQAPAVNGAPSNCALPECSLHFHMGTSTDYRRIGVYSRDSAPGIIVAHGNAGSYLTDTGSVYITRDGGLTWQQTLDYTWHVEIIDHGGLLVAAKDNHQDYSMTIKYSCNEGMSWSDFDFISSSIVVWGVVTEPGETTTQVLLLGTNSRLSFSPWIITHINFTSIFLRTCEASDYYQWTVSDGRIGDQQCLLGETRIIERRRPSVCCWNSRQYERLISATPCQCTAADFECEWGYYRDDNSGDCTLNVAYGPNLDCLTGYRKIAGDVCYGGVSAQYLPPSDCVMDNRDNSSMFDVCVTDEGDSSPRSNTTVIDNDDSTRTNDTVMDNDNSTRSNNSVTVIDEGGPSRYNKSVGRKSDDADHNSSTVAISVSVIVAVITVATLTMIVLVIIFIVKKRKKTSSSIVHADVTNIKAEPNIYEVPPAREATVFTNYKSLKEQEVYDA